MHYSVVLLLFIGIAIVAWIYTVVTENIKRLGFGLIGVILLVLVVLSGVALMVVTYVFGPACAFVEKVYEDPEVVLSTEIPLTTFKNTDYYLIKEDGKYRYCCEAVTNNDNGSKAEISKCKITYSDEAPSLTTKEIAREWRSEWLFMYDSGTEKKTVYYFTVPSKNSILDLDES